MPPRNPEDMHFEFAGAFNRGDIDALMTLYESEAIITPEAGKPPVEGKDAIREVLSGFLALKGTIEIQSKSTFKTGDLALTHGSFSLAGTAPDGSAINLSGNTTEVLRRQPDGTWLCVIDNPFGGG